MNAEEVARAEMTAWNHLDVDEAMKVLRPGRCRRHRPLYPRLSGHDAIRKTLDAYFKRATECDLKILHLAVDGDVVLMERFYYWDSEWEAIDTPVMGRLRVKHQKITAWREYLIPPENP